MRALIFCLLVLQALVANAQQPPALPCMKGDAKCAAAERLKSPTRNKSYWAAAFDKPLEQRFGIAPEELLVYLNLDNMAEGFPNTPHAVTPSADLLKDVGDAIAELPIEIKALVDKKLAGIYFVSDLGGTGYTDYARGGWFSRDTGFIVLDMDVLARQSANAWATWKENTPFRPDAAYQLEAQIENAAGDNRKNAIQYILLHELAHVLSIGEDFHPEWDKPRRSLEKFPFSHLSWKFVPADGSYETRYDESFSRIRKDVKYYFGAKLDASRMNEAYEKLQATNFPTLYAATNPMDDFAESFVTYVHTVLQKRPWEIRLFREGKLARRVVACWEEKRCAEKRRLLESILGIKP